MGIYCCCGSKISTNEECKCDWEGWISTCDWPPERKNKDTPVQKKPDKEGIYLCRWQDNGADRHEEALKFHIEPYRIDVGIYCDIKIPIHWEKESWEEGTPYAFKPIRVIL